MEPAAICDGCTITACDGHHCKQSQQSH